MTWLNVAFNNFIGGEVSPDVYGRYDIESYKKACEALVNFLVRAQGPAFFRPGFKYVTMTRLNKFAVLKKFVFNSDEAYVLEFTDQKLRFYKDQIPVTEAEKTITGVSQAAQAVFTSVGHGYSNGDEIYLYEIVGPDSLNGKQYIVSDKTTDTYKLKDVDGNYISTASLNAYVSGGVSARVYEITTPYLESDDLKLIQVAQNADTMYIVHPKYQPRKLTRTTDTNWALATFTGTNFPFTSSGNYPRSVAFAQGRIWYGGTDNAIDKFWGSRGPTDTGATRYDDFTTGTAADNAVVFILASASGKVEAIRWMATNNKYLVIGTYGGVSKVTGASDDSAISATSVNVRQLSSYGCELGNPVVLGNSVYYVQRGGLVAREIYYDVYQDSFVSENRLLLASRIVGDGISQIDFSSGRLDVLWGLRKDGTLLGMSVNKSENVFGWHRHTIGGNPEVERLTTIPQAEWDDQLWIVTNRTINGKTRRYVEYQVNEILFPEPLDFYTGDKDADQKRYDNVIFSKQQQYKHLDCHLTYDSSSYGEGKNATLTLTFVDDEVTVVSNAAVFSAEDVGREIWGCYDSAGIGGGRYRITSYTSDTDVVCEVLSEPDDTTIALDPGCWYFTTDTVSGLEHLEGETVQVVVDGGVHPDVTVSGGTIALEAHHAIIHVGYKYQGIMKSLNIEGGGINGPAQSKLKKITDIGVRMLNTLGAKVGSDIYNMEPVLYASTNQYTGRPPQPFTGIKRIPIQDEWVGDNADDILTQAVVVQDDPLPCEIQMVDVYFETTNE